MVGKETLEQSQAGQVEGAAGQGSQVWVVGRSQVKGVGRSQVQVVQGTRTQVVQGSQVQVVPSNQVQVLGSQAWEELELGSQVLEVGSQWVGS